MRRRDPEETTAMQAQEAAEAVQLKMAIRAAKEAALPPELDYVAATKEVWATLTALLARINPRGTAGGGGDYDALKIMKATLASLESLTLSGVPRIWEAAYRPESDHSA